ncbi:MAG: hypothetical protein WC479_10665 [Candidatus Izemoplasmatales bacterium]|jgi:hypothetical protein|nr:hypothetical protein [Candidatus Omnitrophota bacterium]
MKILMLKTVKGSPNGILVEEYQQGETYDVQSESLVKVFVANNYATVCKEAFDELKAVEPTYEKKVMSAPKNKQTETKED